MAIHSKQDEYQRLKLSGQLMESYDRYPGLKDWLASVCWGSDWEPPSCPVSQHSKMSGLMYGTVIGNCADAIISKRPTDLYSNEIKKRAKSVIAYIVRPTEKGGLGLIIKEVQTRIVSTHWKTRSRTDFTCINPRTGEPRVFVPSDTV